MNIKIEVYADDKEKEKKWIKELSTLLNSFLQLEVCEGQVSDPQGQILILDGSSSKVEFLIHSFQKKRNGKALFLVLEEQIRQFPHLLQSHDVDDLVVYPFRVLEVVSKVMHYEKLILWQEVAHVNSSLSELLEYVQEDISLAERLQRAKVPKRFPSVQGFKIANRYLAGMRSGGDYFDLAESKDQNHLSFMMTHASSYGLCSSVVSILMRVALKLTIDQLDQEGVTSEIVKQISDEISMTLGEKDSLTLFFGHLVRKERVFRYTHCGDLLFFYAPPGRPFEFKQAQGARIYLEQSLSGVVEESFQVEEGGRLVLLSAGFIDSVQGGQKTLNQILDELRNYDIEEVLNEMIFRVKSQCGEIEMPARDCSGVVFEILPGFDKKIVQLTKPKPKQVGN